MLICILVILVTRCVVAASTVEHEITRDLPSRERNLREHKVAEALADAFVDALRTKAKYENGDVTQQQESATREKDTKAEESLAQDTRPSRSSSSQDLASKEAPSPPTEKKASIEETLDAKLAAIEKEMDELKALKQEIASMKGNGGADQKRRRLLDQGLPGWDPGVLYHKKTDLLGDKVNLLERKSSDVAHRIEDRILDLMTSNADQLSILSGMHSDGLIERTDIIRSVLEGVRRMHQDKTGRIQDRLADLIDKKAQKFDNFVESL